MITAGRYTTETAVSAIEAKLADAVPFGRMFIANPDLPQRIRAGVPLNAFDRSAAYGGGAHELLVFSSFGSTGESRRAIFCDDRRVLSLQPRQDFRSRGSPNRSPTTRFPVNREKCRKSADLASQDSSARRISWSCRVLVMNSRRIRTAKDVFGTGNS
jgi:hypothetical protein